MFGKLKLSSIPTNEPIIMVTFFIISVITICILITMSYFKKWTWLWKDWLTSVDHKKIGIMYIIVSFIMLVRGFADAIMMKTQQALVSSGEEGFLPPYHYDQIFTAHGVIMIFFMATPLILGLMNFIIPLQIGARDVAFPFLNSLSFWLFVSGAILMNLSLFIGEFAQTGWLAYPPLSGKEYSPGVGVDYWIWSLQVSGIGTLLTGINLISTIIKMRAPGMLMMKMPVFSWTSFCSSILIVAAFPVLTVTILLLTLDRYIGTHFFTNDMGGNMMMYINLIWAWGHPEVYILVLPVFGIFSEITATFCKKTLFGYKSLILATISITIMSFIVWLHHFFTMGGGANVNSFFGIATMIIAIPTGVKIFNWLFTIYKSKTDFKTPMLWTIGFIITFSIGGMAGVILSVPGINYLLHNSLFLIAHFHNVIIGGVVFGCFAGITYWFPKAFGFKLNEKLGTISFFIWIIGFLTTFIPVYILGFMGMTRRLSQNIDPEYNTMLFISFIGTVLIGIGIITQIFQVIFSVINRKKNLDTTGDPWNGRTLEWSTLSPVPIYNFSIKPKNISTLDAWWKIKNNNIKKNKNLKYKNIKIPKNTSTGIEISVFSLIFCFSMIWYIFWLAAISLMVIFLILFNKFLKKNEKTIISAQEIEKIEKKNIISFKN